MFLDASAIIAILAREEDGAKLSAVLDQAPKTYTSAIAIYEASLGLARTLNMQIADARKVVDKTLAEKRTEIVPLGASIGIAALDAFARFGKGNHPAKLNMGDCFAYACARELQVPLLFKGNDFAQTDIEPA